MKITLSSASPLSLSAEMLVIGAKTTSFGKDETLAQIDKALGGGLKGLAKDEGFTAKAGQVLKVPGGDLKAKWVVLVGLDGEDTVAHARALAHTAAKASSRQRSAAIVLPATGVEQVRAAAQAVALGAYRYSQLKTGDRKPKGGLSSAQIVIAKKADAKLKRALAAGIGVAEGVSIARDLVNGPPNVVNPITFANTAKREAAKLKLKCTVWGKSQLKKAGMKLFLAVNSGSAIEPRMIHIVYKPAKAKAKVAFVGKGLTFDAGGLCLKPAKSMLGMKCDMAGGAATLGIVLAAARLKVPVEVHAIIGCTENMTGAAAYRPSDVFTSYSGKSVEIINTDAEGRLVLADCLSYVATKIKPDIIVDHATLTGACMVALGPNRAAFYSDDEKVSALYQEAAKGADENIWQMPLDKKLRPQLDSFVADLKHTGGPYGGSITAALFLREFVGKTRWAHLDIAGPAFLDAPIDRAPKGGTGFGVDMGVRFLESL
ncbi:MAG: leucyl aminopeptidase [Myxococcota bacterium]